MGNASRTTVTLVLAVAALAACGTGGAPPAGRSAPSLAADGGALSPSPGVGRSMNGASPGREALSREQAATLASLRKVDDHPLWTMTFQGGYDRLATVTPTLTPDTFGCSLFAAHGDPAAPVFGRNFDFDHQPALLLFTSPPDGYASVSMVDVSYLGLRSDADFTTDAGRRALLRAPLLPFDGMNAKGLAVGMATVPEAKPTFDGKRRTVGSLRVQRLVLDQAATVDEAIAVFSRYNVDFSDSPPLHYMFADAQGRSAVVEFSGGEMVVRRGEGPWQAMTNFTLATSTEESRRADQRYRTLSEALESSGGKASDDRAMDLLADVRQGHTQWSIVYGQKSGEVRLATGQRYGTVHRFHLPAG
ncbi:carcinine hydrolase/isopenicillin-N N-acyltransferase family protein [Microtetraspora malaysiensis]|uniref:carcinine hydrolase/isopenicillin-N N-acyltransferase family protein n=1 Tax=Microtetraspora malaysiensis TaxID=161358 RepID=UPI00082C606B|nr:C45 family peptidase [Microtetraspora malaysiensis]